MPSQSDSEMLGGREEVALDNLIANFEELSNSFAKVDDENVEEDVITLSDDEEDDYYLCDIQEDDNQPLRTNSQKRQREPDVDSDDSFSSIDQLNSNLSKKTRATEECANDFRGSIEEDSDDCLIVYEEQDQYSTANFASYSAKIEETAQKSLDFLSIAEDQCKQNREMLSALGRQLNAMMPGKGMKKSISSLSITKQNDFSCKLIDCEAKLIQSTVNLQEREDEVNALKSQLDDIEKDNEDNSKLSDFKEKIAEYEAVIKELSSENQQGKDEIDTLKMQLREYSCGIEEKEGKILSLENRLNECQQQKNDECDTMKMKICKLTNQFEETHGMNVSLSKQMDSLRDQIKQVTEEKCKLMDQVKDRDQVISNMADPSTDSFSRSVEYLKLKERIKELEEDQSKLTVALEDKDNQIATLTNLNASLNTSVATLTTTLAEINKFNSVADCMIEFVAVSKASMIATKAEPDPQMASCASSAASTSVGTNQSTSHQSKTVGPVAIVNKADLQPNADGVYVDLFPLNEEMLKKLKEDGWSAEKFVHQLMEYVFTKDYLCTKTYSKMVPRHYKEIVEATLRMYKTFRNSGETVEQPLNNDKVKEYVQKKFSESKKGTKNESVSLRGNQSRRSK